MELQNYLNCCRFCLNFVEVYERVELGDKVKESFKELTSIELITSSSFASFSCNKCLEKLKNSLETKREFIKNQIYLYDIPVVKTEPEVEKLEQSADSEPLEKRKQNFKNTKRKSKKSSNNSSAKEKVSCSDCGLIVNRQSLKRHQEAIHLKIKRFNCDICGRSFNKKCRIIDHLNSHAGIKNFSCSFSKCQMKFSSKPTLQAHIKMIHEKRYEKICHLCGKKLPTKTYFENHLRSKHFPNVRPFACEVEGCNKRFFAKTDVWSHKKNVHCGQQECQVCGRMLASEHALKMHTKSLHEERKFVCEFEVEGKPCNKRYPTRYDLKCHVNSCHYGIKKHQCPVCEMNFSIKKYMENHIRTIHQNKKIQCELCNALICDKIYYKRHVQNHHKDLDASVRECLLLKIRSTKEEDLFNYQK